jgi:hypothetical protein
MIIKEAQFEVCECCGKRQRTAPPQLGCDYCQKPIAADGGLAITVFFKDGGDTVDYYFCSWQCLFDKLPSIETDYFIDLPKLSFDEDTPGQTVADFWKAARGAAG